MPRHPKDHNADNPRMQCSVCKRWMRENGVRTNERGEREAFSRFYGCSYGNGDHLAGDHETVCEACCLRECHKLAHEDGCAISKE